MQTDCLVIGASALGCGYAYSNAGSCIVVEPSMLVASEFCSTYRYELGTNPENLCVSAAELYRDMESRNLLKDGRMSSIPVSCLFSKRLLEKNIPVILSAVVYGVQKTEAGYCVTVFTSDGEREIHCRKILDTTAQGAVFKEQFPVIKIKKTLRAVLCYEKKAELSAKHLSDIDNVEMDGVRIIKGRFSDEYAFEVSVSENCGYMEARKILTDKFLFLKEKGLMGWRIAAISSFFDFGFNKTVSVKTDTDCMWAPSASYGDAVLAFEGGLLCSI